MGIIELIIMVPTMVLPINMNQVRLKSCRLPPTRPKVLGLYVIFALTITSKIAVLKNCIQKVI